MEIVNNTITDDTQDISMDNLYPALVQCFGIIICGYLAGRLNIVTNTEAKGLNTFVGTFALPSLIFLSLAQLNWSTVNWNFLLSILISKTIVFAIVIILTLLVARPLNYGRAGLLAIFCTQSNDFAIGFPIVKALYMHAHPEYADYIYLMAPISLAILNPIGYILMEITKLKEKNAVTETEENVNVQCPSLQSIENKKRCFPKGKFLVIIKTLESILFNPILFMTVLGVIGGFVFPSGLPEMVTSFLKVLGDSFAATSLFLLGLRMVGKAHNFQGSTFLLPGILIIVKILVLPLVTRQTVNIISAGTNFSDTTDLSTFGFLYGTFPAAPGAFVIATRYNIDVDLIASSMVACTFISAPLMFISAKMISITNLNPSDYLNELDKFAFDISIAAMIASVYILLLFGLTNKIRKMPHRITSSLLFSQLIGSVGIILWSTLGQNSNWGMYLQFSFFTIGTFSSRLWTAFLAISLLFLQCRSLCFVLKLWPLFNFLAWGIPTLLVAILFMFDSQNITPSDKRNPSFQYGNCQAAISVFLHVMCFIVIVGCLVLHQRYKKRYERYISLSKEVSSPDNETLNNSSMEERHLSINSERIRRLSLTSSDDEIIAQSKSSRNGGCDGNTDNCCSRSTTVTTVVDIEDLLVIKNTTDNSESTDETPGANGLCSTQFNCAGTSRQTCQNLIQRYQEQAQNGLEPIEFDENADEHQTLKHTVLLILLLCSMFVGLALSIWTLVMEGMSGIYVELTFLDAFLNFGQSLIVLAVFITDTSELLMPFMKYWRQIWYGANMLKLPTFSELSNETKLVCDQFTKHHLDNCRKKIAKDKRWRIRVYKKVFYGNIFVDWLIEVGLAKDRPEAIQYARRLVDGRILRHINNVYHFHDKNLLYTFCDRL